MKNLWMILLALALIQSCGKGSNPPPGVPPGAALPTEGAPPTPPPGGIPGVPTNPSVPGVPSAAPQRAPTAGGAVTTPVAPEAKPEKKNVLETMKAGQLQEYYNPSGKRDPFKPFEGGEIVYSAVAKAPLERFELNQLELTAIVWGIARPKVLFRAPDGYSYIAQVGTGIGRNRGKITKITKNRVLIAEAFRDPSGQYVARESEFEMEQDKTSERLFQEMELKYSDE